MHKKFDTENKKLLNLSFPITLPNSNRFRWRHKRINFQNRYLVPDVKCPLIKQQSVVILSEIIVERSEVIERLSNVCMIDIQQALTHCQ